MQNPPPQPPNPQDKKELRKYYRLLRAAIPAAERAQHNAVIHAQLLALPEMHQAHTVFSYYNTPAEVSTIELLDNLNGACKAIWLPSSDRTSLPAESTVEAHPFAHNPPAQPVVSLSIAEIDIVVVPAVVWNTSGYRVGYGGGYFDRLLQRLRPDCITVGLGYECQVAPSLPVDPWDLPVGILVTEARTHRIAR